MRGSRAVVACSVHGVCLLLLSPLLLHLHDVRRSHGHVCVRMLLLVIVAHDGVLGSHRSHLRFDAIVRTIVHVHRLRRQRLRHQIFGLGKLLHTREADRTQQNTTMSSRPPQSASVTLAARVPACLPRLTFAVMKNSTHCDEMPSADAIGIMCWMDNKPDKANTTTNTHRERHSESDCAHEDESRSTCACVCSRRTVDPNSKV